MYVKKSGNKWIAFHTIPENLRQFFGDRPRLSAATGVTATGVAGGKAEAEIAAAPIAARWYDQLAQARAALARGQTGASFQIDRGGKKIPDLFEIAGYQWMSGHSPERMALIAATRARRDAGEELSEADKFVLSELDIFPDRPLHDGDPQPRPATKVKGKLEGLIDDWLKTLIGDTEKTKHMKKTDAERFAARFVHLKSVKKPDVQSWVNAQLANGAAVATVRRMLSNIRGYWRYLQSVGDVDEDYNPLAGLLLPAAASTSIEVAPFTAKEVSTLLATARKGDDGVLADFVEVARYSGARIEEIAMLRVEHIVDGDLIILGTKTDNAPRRLPIHPQLTPILARLALGRTEGFLFDGLAKNKFGDRSNAVGKRFGKMKTKAGFGREKVFHSIRKCVSSLMWSKGVHPALISQILGHESGILGIDVYAKDPGREAKLVAIEKLNYPDEATA